MTNTTKVLIGSGVIFLLSVMAAVIATGVAKAHKAEIVALQNEIAKRDQTIEVQKGVYTKLALTSARLELLLTGSVQENERLIAELKDRKAQLLTAQSVSVQWKKAYEALVKANQTEETTPEGVVRKKVEFQKDFGYIIAEGHTLTDPPEAFIRVKQGRPLRLSVIMTQEPDKSWRAYATSSEENIGVSIDIAAVNPHLLDSKWYEKIGLHADVGIGTGGLVGLGASYKIGKFTVGPSVWGSMGLDFAPKGYVGVTMGWNPFQKD
jgi:hypothetical protein